MLNRLLGTDLINWRTIRADQILTFLGVTLTVFLALCAVLTAKGVNSLVRDTAADIQIQIFWSPERITSRDVTREWEKISKWPGVIKLTTYTQDQALQRMRDDIGSDLDLSWLSAQNPLPPTAVVDLDPAAGDPVPAIINRVQSLPGVTAVHSNPLQVHLAGAWSRIAGTVIWPVVAFLLLTQGFILANTVRLGLTHLREDIEVLRLVGATRWACQAPILARVLAVSMLGTTAGLAGLKLLHLRVNALLAAPPLHLSCPFLSWPEIAGMYLVVAVVSTASCALAIHMQGL